MSEHHTFVERVLAGEIYDLDVVYNDVDAWHDGGGYGCELHEWLGFTKEEYALFVGQPNALGPIFSARRYNLDVATFMQMSEDAIPLAARGGSAEETASLVAWLKKTGRI